MQIDFALSPLIFHPELLELRNVCAQFALPPLQNLLHFIQKERARFIFVPLSTAIRLTRLAFLKAITSASFSRRISFYKCRRPQMVTVILQERMLDIFFLGHEYRGREYAASGRTSAMLRGCMKPISPIFPAEMRGVASRRLPFAVMSVPVASSEEHPVRHFSSFLGGPFLIQRKLILLYIYLFIIYIYFYIS